MIQRANASRGLDRLLRLAAWLVPPHRKEWAAAMLNEVEHIESHRAAVDWAVGCAVVAFKERLAYEVGRLFMTRRILKLTLGAGVLLVLGCTGIYIDAKPYQRDRIWLEFRDALSVAPAQDSGRVKRP